MKVIKNIFIFLFFLFTPVFFIESAFPMWFAMIILFCFWGFLFFWILNGVWSLFFAKSIKESFSEFFPNFKLTAAIPYISIGLIFLITPIILISNPSIAYDFLVVLFMWGVLLLYIGIKLTNSLLKFFGVGLDEIFPSINNNRNLFLLVNLYVFLIVFALFFAGQDLIETGYNIWISLLLLIAIFIWSLIIAYKFIKETTKSGSIVIFVVLGLVIMYVIAVLTQPSYDSPRSKVQEYKDIICDVTNNEVDGCP